MNSSGSVVTIIPDWRAAALKTALDEVSAPVCEAAAFAP